MPSTNYDIAILGAGPVGCVLALSLARHAPDPGRIALMGPAPAQRAAGQSIDPRAIAINHGSRQFLQQLGAWPGHSADISTVHVSQAGHLGRTLIDHTELHVPRLGSVVAYDELLESLHTALAQSGITRILQRPSRPQAGQPVILKTADDTHHSTRLALISDGSRPQGLHRDYQQHAILTTVRASQAIPGRAFERFTQTGPLALLPHPAGQGLYSVVWCVRPAQATALSVMDDTTFDTRLQQAFGTRLGTLRRLTPVNTFPLALHAGPSLQGEGVVAVGNAAQTLHPVAGQGLNLGLRDVAQLSHVLQPWLVQPAQALQPLLQQYARQRKIDRTVTLAITDTLPRIFASRYALPRHLAGLGLVLLDLIPGLRQPLAHHLLQGQRQ
ncbi:FAD-dependent monooxygenase [Castellaniella sp.]|uniref:FAD-dependent monooxygenase n=1 Tax=Castellaniella sp. TaxID=1955812 RepID=UPI003C76EACE